MIRIYLYIEEDNDECVDFEYYSEVIPRIGETIISDEYKDKQWLVKSIYHVVDRAITETECNVGVDIIDVRKDKTDYIAGE